MKHRASVFLLNIGNSRVQMKKIVDGAGGELRTIPTAEFQADLVFGSGLPVAAACVVPEWTERLRAEGAFLVGKDKQLPFDCSQMDMSTEGADRLANAAVLASGPLPALAVDFGTAINSEYVDSTGRFLGGAILPGRHLIRRALHLFTGQLPEIPFYETPAFYPASNTADALRWGTDSLLLAGVKELLKEAGEKSPPGMPAPYCVACGGDRDFFLRHLPGIFVKGEEDFTLTGVQLIWEQNHHES